MIVKYPLNRLPEAVPDKLINGQLQTLIDAAILAPSGDNMQPWRFEVNQLEVTISISIDEKCDTSPMNAGQYMSRIACGAAIENIVQTASHNDWRVSVSQSTGSPNVATVKLLEADGSRGHVPDSITNRHTNRTIYDKQELKLGSRDRLAAAVPNSPEVEVIWITNAQQIDRWARVIGAADAKMFRKAGFLNAFLDNVRFDVPPDTITEQGLSTGSLELSWLERQLMSLLRHAPEFLVCSGLLNQSFSSHSRKLVRSSSGICCVVSKRSENINGWQVGRFMQRAWISLVDAGYQVQPMMSIPVLANAGSYARAELPHWQPQHSPPLAILRFGFGSATQARAGRIPASRIVTKC